MAAYFGFGADLVLRDLAYVQALVASLVRDLSTVLAANGANLTEGIYNLIVDKGLMAQEAMGMLKDSAVAKANPVLYKRVTDLWNEAQTKYTAVEKMTPKKDVQPFSPPPYSAGSVFAAPPAPTFPLSATAKNVYTPATITAQEMFAPGLTTGYARRGDVVKTTSAPAGGIGPLGLIAAAAGLLLLAR